MYIYIIYEYEREQDIGTSLIRTSIEPIYDLRSEELKIRTVYTGGANKAIQMKFGRRFFHRVIG